MSRVGFGLAAVAVVAASCLLAGCSSDPVHDGEVQALGPEVPGMPKSLYQYHRAGQPCLVCHGGQGPSSKQFSIAGTIFAGPFSDTGDNTLGVSGATVAYVDDNTSTNFSTTNCVGNFWLLADGSTGWPNFPAFPILTEVISPGSPPVVTPMIGHIGRDGSCSSCHSDPPGPTTLGHVYANYSSPTTPSCPVNPIAGGT